MQKMLIWSRAIVLNKSLVGTPFEGFEKHKALADYDYATDVDEYGSEMINWVRYELHPMPELFAFQARDINDILLSIKLSHCIYDISFNKTMKDIALLRFLWAKPIDELLLILQEKWKQPKFTKTHKRDYRGFDFPHEELFNDNVPRLIEHNELHKLISMMARGDPEPMYVKMLKEKKLSSLEKATHEQRLWTNLEEALVFTFERHYELAMRWGIVVAYIKALKDLITRCSPEKEALWMAENYQELRTIDPEIISRIYTLIKTIYGNNNAVIHMA